MTSPRRRLLIAGAVALVLVVVVGGIAAKYLSRTNVIHVTAQFDSVAGLYEEIGSPSCGMQVGNVTEITPKGGYVEVELTIDKDVKIPPTPTRSPSPTRSSPTVGSELTPHTAAVR